MTDESDQTTAHPSADAIQAVPTEQPSISEPEDSPAQRSQAVFDPFLDWPSLSRSWWPELEQSVAGALERREFDLAVSLATTILEESVRAMADAPPGLGGNKLYEYAFRSGDGALTAGVPGGEATGYANFFCGISQAYRNKAHHNSRSNLTAHEALQVLNAANLGLTITRRLAFQTYLAPFVPDTGLYYLLESREVDIDGQGQRYRFVTFAAGSNPPIGRVIALRKSSIGWRRIRGSVYMQNAYLSGKIVVASCTLEDRLQVFVSFARPIIPSKVSSFAIAPLDIDGDELKIIAAPPEATWSFGWPHEVKDALGLGSSQLISHRVLDNGDIARLYFGIGQEGFQPLAQELEQRQGHSS